ncbi:MULTISPECIES: ABC transporter permease [Paraburkholderia]|uniref:Autoinducer 2 import system permease protein LsrD n=1 Tax=Paraburkholderia tropica TaxID=92647 RepID=A0ABX5MU50_9BURK|nr:ABC transporter permease [Paraburkholderia tropica]MBB3001199.1 ribose transport system permease protein [Paraburkholderia tropica]MBB6320831.1 ribose transport system permease protein [Paraburkholderia tropica]MDE1140724.1 ABC transporter permease [Paraburkholderia tropica]PXX19124.1 monosaccharide ABC transporter membrane protein (CUT2 family) [Paraburkholderia tropica]PZW88147.1 monosaccharide ABC transporter membrane protein (CUT2 family) [Paraburkholderia tropica]
MINRLASRRADRNGGQYVSGLLLLVAVVALGASFSSFRTPQNLANLIVQATPLLVVALGQTLPILTGGLDLSVGVVMSLSTCILATTGSPALAIALTVASAALVGVVNGIGVTRFRVHPIIMTLSTGTILQGIVLLVQPSPGGSIWAPISAAVGNSVMGVPVAVLWVALAAWIAWSLLHRSRFGLHLYSVGGGADNAALAGVGVARTTIAAYVLCALFAAVAGIFLAGRISSGDPWVGASYGLDSVAAVALGGTQLSGGVGGPLGTIFGALLLGIVGNGMNIVQINPFLLSVVNGTLLLFAVCLRRRKEIGI